MIAVMLYTFLFWIILFFLVFWKDGLDSRARKRDQERSRKFWAERNRQQT